MGVGNGGSSSSQSEGTALGGSERGQTSAAPLHPGEASPPDPQGVVKDGRKGVCVGQGGSGEDDMGKSLEKECRKCVKKESPVGVFSLSL